VRKAAASSRRRPCAPLAVHPRGAGQLRRDPVVSGARCRALGVLCLGAPRVHAELRAAGVRCAPKRVARLLRAAGLVGCHRRRRARTTVAGPTHTPAPNLVARVPRATAPDRLRVGDIAYVATAEGRRGWALSTTPIAAASIRRQHSRRF